MTLEVFLETGHVEGGSGGGSVSIPVEANTESTEKLLSSLSGVEVGSKGDKGWTGDAGGVLRMTLCLCR